MADLPEWAIDADDIPNHACLLRRIPPFALAGRSPDSSNFRSKEVGRGLSVTVWTGDGDLADVQRWHEECGVVTIVAADARALGLRIARAPLVGNLNHCELFPAASKGRQSLLRNACEWVIYPEAISVEQREATVKWRAQWHARISAEDVARVCPNQ